MARSVLDTAKRLASQGRHSAVICLLESRLPLFRESHAYYYLLGTACLRTGDIGGANTYIRRAVQLDDRDRDTRLCLAALLLRRGETEKAIALYLGILEDRPSDRIARRALARLRKADVHEGGVHAFEGRALESLLPPARGLPPWILPLGGLFLLVALLILLFPLAGNLVRGIVDSRAPRTDVAAVSLSDSDRASPIAKATSARYILTEKEALAAFDRAKAYFQSYRDNAALVDLNRILQSNASDSLREKARTLMTFVAAPDWRTLRDIPAFKEVKADPALYRGCAVIWRGRAANVSGSAAKREFDFLAGYADKDRLDGIVRVRVDSPSLSIPKDGPFELLSRVVDEGGGFSLEAIALHELAEGK